MHVHTHSYAHVVYSYTFIRFPYQIFLLFFFFFHSFACSGLVAVMTNSLLSVFPDSKAARWSASAFKSPPRIVVWLTPTKPAASNSACGSNLAQACVRARGRGRRGGEGRMYACELTNTYDPPQKKQDYLIEEAMLELKMQLQKKEKKNQSTETTANASQLRECSEKLRCPPEIHDVCKQHLCFRPPSAPTQSERMRGF